MSFALAFDLNVVKTTKKLGTLFLVSWSLGLLGGTKGTWLLWSVLRQACFYFSF